MSDKWETVVSAKPVKGKANGKKASPKPMPKLEDILPAGSIQAMYAGLHDEITQEAVKEVKKKEPEPAKMEPKKTMKKDPAAPSKPKLPANIQEAVRKNLRVDDVKHLIESCQTKFPDSPLLWLRDIAAYLNLKLVNEDSTEPAVFDGSPLSALTQNMKKAVYALVQNLPESMKETYLETCISNTAHDMAKSLDTAGWRIMTQVITDISPGLITSNLPRLIELRNSYQNRPNIGLAILWSVGQAGKKDLQSGVRVWLDVMLPLLSMKHYTKFIVEYIAILLNQHRITKDTVLAKPVMDLANFVTVQDTVFLVSSQINKEYSRQLRDMYPQLQAAALAGYKNHEIFPIFMEKLKTQNMPDQVLDSLDILAKCLVATPAALVHWHRLYTSHLSQSGQLLQYLDTHWTRFNAVGTLEFQDTVQAFQDYLITATYKEDIQGGRLCRDGCAALLARVSRTGGYWFPWKTLSFLLLIGSAAIINLDVKKNGTFSSSHTGHFLKDLGQYDRTVELYSQGHGLYLTGYNWTEKTVPVYYGKARKVAGPALDTALDNVKVAGLYLYSQGEESVNLLLVKGGEVYLLAKEKGGEVYLQAREGLSSLQAQYPGVQEQGAVYLSTLQQGLRTLAEKVVTAWQEVVGGKVDWSQVKDGALLKLGELQAAALQLVEWSRNQIQQLIK